MHRIVLAIIFIGSWATTGHSEEVRCDDTDVIVFAGPEDARLVCDVAKAGSDLLRDCGLEPDWPVQIVVSEVIEGAPTHCIGQFVCGTGRITLLSPETLAKRADTAEMFPGMTPAAIFASLVVHEMAHAALSHTAPGLSSDLTTQEYIATAMQFRSISPPDRARFLEAWPVETPVDMHGLNQFTHALAPGLFMSRVWLHFDAPENGCAFVAELIDGSARLGLPDL